MFRILAIAVIVGIFFFILGICFGAQRHQEPKKPQKDLKCFLRK